MWPSSFRQRPREEIELRIELNKSLKAAELTLSRGSVDEDTSPLSAAIRHDAHHRVEATSEILD